MPEGLGRYKELLADAHRLMDRPDWPGHWPGLTRRADAAWARLSGAERAAALAEANRLYQLRIGG